MIECFIYLIVWCIAAVLFIFLLEYLIGLFVSLPSQVFALIRILVGLLVLLMFIRCMGFGNYPLFPRGRTY